MFAPCLIRLLSPCWRSLGASSFPDLVGVSVIAFASLVKFFVISMNTNRLGLPLLLMLIIWVIEADPLGVSTSSYVP
jgi:hypothetical protein